MGIDMPLRIIGQAMAQIPELFVCLFVVLKIINNCERMCPILRICTRSKYFAVNLPLIKGGILVDLNALSVYF